MERYITDKLAKNKIMFKEGDILRNKKTGIAYLVCYVNMVCLLVSDLREKNNPTMLFAILPRDYHFYARDQDMNCYTVKQYAYWKDERNIFTVATKIRLR